MDEETYLPKLEGRNHKTILHSLDPERCGHLRRIRVRPSRGTMQESNIGRPTSQLRAYGFGGHGEDKSLGDRLSYIVVAQNGVRVREHGLGDCALGDELAQVLR